MDIIKHLTNAKIQIKAEEEREIALVKDRIMREKIAPFNQEIDQARIKAEAELSTELNSQITALQQDFANKKQALFEAGEKKKAEHLNSIMATETYAITSKADKAIAKIDAQIKELEE